MKLSKLADLVANQGSAAWDIHLQAKRAKANGEDVIIMSVGDNDIDTDPAIVETACSAMQNGATHYVEPRGIFPLRKAVAEHLSIASGVECKANSVTITAGTQNALFIASALLLEADDEVIVADPMYVTYGATLGAFGAQIVCLPCPAELGFQPDIVQLDALVTDRTKAIFFASPVNPTGTVFSRVVLEEIANVAVKHDLWVVADEVYRLIAFDDDPVPMMSLPGMAERCITIGSLSKSHSMSGWRIGWACGPETFSNRASALSLAMTYGLPGFIQLAGVKALGINPGGLKDHYRHLRDIAVETLVRESNVRVMVPESGMFILLPVAATGLSGDEFVRKLYRETGVSVLNAELFGPQLKDMVRVTFALEENELREGLGRICRFFSDQIPVPNTVHAGLLH